MLTGNRILRLLRNLAATREGAGSVEFAAIMAFFLLPLVIMLIDVGEGMYKQMQVGNSARAGAEYATYCHCADDQQIVPVVVTTIQTAEQTATGLGTSVNAHTAQFCGCITAGGSVSMSFTNPDGTTTTANVPGLSLAPGATIYKDPVLNGTTNLPSCNVAGTTACADGSAPGTYVTVTASTKFTPHLPYPGIVPASGFFEPNANATARIY
jgi:Flp pilus assembly protein TadG